MKTIQLNGEEFPLAVTSEGEKLTRQLGVNMNAVNFGIAGEKLRYLYCMAAGAAMEENRDFPFKLQEFLKAAPGNWEKLADELRASPNPSEGGEKEKEKEAHKPPKRANKKKKDV